MVSSMKPRLQDERQPSSVGDGTTVKVFTVPCRNVVQGAEGGLAVLILGEIVVGLNALEPDAGFDLIAAARPVDVVVEGEEVARGGVVAADVGAGLRDLRMRRWRRCCR